jgi:hypothetical protein
MGRQPPVVWIPPSVLSRHIVSSSDTGEAEAEPGHRTPGQPRPGVPGALITRTPPPPAPARPRQLGPGDSTFQRLLTCVDL